MAFVRITSGQYSRGMALSHVRTGKKMNVNNATTFLAQDRVVTQEAFPGDIIGLHNHGGIRIGDTFTEGEQLKFKGIPAFAPELFRRVQLLDPLKSKALMKGLQELSEEGAAQLFRPLEGSDYIIGALGVLQFDVIASRLEAEYRVRARFEAAPLAAARWVDSEDEDKLDQFISENRRRVYRDINDKYTYIAQSEWAVNYAAEHARYRFSQDHGNLSRTPASNLRHSFKAALRHTAPPASLPDRRAASSVHRSPVLSSMRSKPVVSP